MHAVRCGERYRLRLLDRPKSLSVTCCFHHSCVVDNVSETLAVPSGGDRGDLSATSCLPGHCLVSSCVTAPFKAGDTNVCLLVPLQGQLPL